MKNGQDHFCGGGPYVKFGNGSKHHELVQKLNATRINGHSIHKLSFDRAGNIVAAKCNCGGGVSHPIIIGDVIWKTPLNEEQVEELKKGELTFLY